MSQDQLDPAIREQLVAYLDGELDADNSRRVEELLANDPRVRATMQGFDRTWELLDELDAPPVRDGFTQTTLEMVALAAAKDAEHARTEAPRRRRRRLLLAAAGLAAAGLAGFLGVMVLLPNPNRQLLQDLPMLENLDEYREIDTIDFLRLLARERLFVEEGDAGSGEEPESLAQRRERVKNMSAAQEERLLNRQQQFEKLDPAGQQRVRQLHEQLQRDPQADKLREVLAALLPVAHGATALSPIASEGSAAAAADPEDQEDSTRAGRGQPVQREGPPGVAAMDRPLRAAARGPAAGNAAPLPQAAVFQAPSRGAAPHGAGPDLPAVAAGRRRVAGGVGQRRVGRSARRAVARDPRRLEALSVAAQSQIVAEWIGQVSRQQAAVRRPAGPRLPNLDEQLAHFFEFHLDEEQRDRLMSLPGDEMQQRLRERFDRFQHERGKKGPALYPSRPEKSGDAAKPPAAEAQ